MVLSKSRRRFLKQGATAGTLVGLGDIGFLSQLRSVSAAESDLDPAVVQLRPEIEPIVRLIEETPREELLEKVAGRIREGLSYRDLLAGLLLAGVKNVEPRPSVGHKFHCVLVVNSAHLASLSSPAEHRWLPIFWALDNYKSSAERDVRERGDWAMSRVDESALPSPTRAPAALEEAMENWDEAAADVSVAQLARSHGAAAVYEPLFRFGMRDFRSIGHKAIFVANSWRTLQCVGWQHAEPVLRSLAYAMLMHEGGNPRDRDAEADRPFRRNVPLAEKMRTDWKAGTIDNAATSDLLATLRSDSNDAACDHVVELIDRGVAPQSIWDALFVGAGELLMRQPGIVALHAVTTTNALYFAYQQTGDDLTRRLAMLQTAAFLPMFRGSMHGRGEVKDIKIDDLEAAPTSPDSSESIAEIFRALSENSPATAAKVLGHLEQTNDAKDLIDAARVLIFLKGNNAHDYKFSSAMLEDYYHVSPEWRNKFLASNVYKLRGSQETDNQLVARTRAALEV